MKCPSCDYQHDKLISLSLHWRRMHKQTSETLRVILFHGGIRPTCACGCGSDVKFHTIEMGFSTYRKGHVARVHNNWGHNEKALEKSHATTKSRYDTGDLKPWNNGLTKETDERVKAYGEKCSETLQDDVDELQARSERLSEYRRSGIVPTQFGENASRWKGGVSKISTLARSLTHNVWTYHKLKAAGFTCQKCGSTVDLCVHHDDIQFHVILRKAVAELGEVTDDSDFEHKTRVAQWVANYHVENNVSGLVLCEPCHAKEHEALAWQLK